MVMFVFMELKKTPCIYSPVIVDVSLINYSLLIYQFYPACRNLGYGREFFPGVGFFPKTWLPSILMGLKTLNPEIIKKSVKIV